MAFTIKGEYDRLIKIKEKSPNKQIPFECGVACGVVTRIEYVPSRYNTEAHIWLNEEIQVYAIAGWEKEEQCAFAITENDVSRRYQDRKYRINQPFGILEYFPYK